MIVRWPRRPRLDIPTAREPARLLLSGIAALMAYVATMTGLGLIGVSDTLANRERSGASSLTLQLPADTSPSRIEVSLAVLRQTPGVVGVRLIEPGEAARLLEPWLGPSVPVDRLPVPRLIELRLDPDATIDFAGLREKLVSVVPGAELEERRAGSDGARKALGRAEGLLGVALLAIAVIGAALMAFATSGELSRNRHTVDLLHLLGADDADIADSFQTDALWRAFGGSAAGAVAGAVTVLAFGRAISLHAGDWRVWGVVVGVGLLVGLIALATARVIVLRRLAGLP